MTNLCGKTKLCVYWVLKLFFVLTEVHMYRGTHGLYNSYPTSTMIHTSNRINYIFLSLYCNSIKSNILI